MGNFIIGLSELFDLSSIINEEFLFQIFKALIVFTLGWIFIRLINHHSILKKLKEFRKFDTGTANFVLRIAKVIEWSVVFLIILGVFNVNLGYLMASVGVVGVVLGFALKDTISNFASGIMIMVYKPFHVGDWIEIPPGISGSVKDIALSAIEIKTLGNQKIVVPNSQVWGVAIKNYSAYPTRRALEDFVIERESDMDKAIEIMKALFKNEHRILDDPEPTIVVKEFTPNGVTLSVRPWMKTSDYWTTLYKLRKDIKEQLAKAKIKFPRQQVDVHKG